MTLRKFKSLTQMTSFIRVADRVERLVAEVDATLEACLVHTGNALQVRPAGLTIDARDQHALGAALFQEAPTLHDAAVGARQDDDAVCCRRGIDRLAHGDGCKKHKSQHEQKDRPSGYADQPSFARPHHSLPAASYCRQLPKYRRPACAALTLSGLKS